MDTCPNGISLERNKEFVPYLNVRFEISAFMAWLSLVSYVVMDKNHKAHLR